MNFLTHTMMLVIGFLMLPIFIGIAEYNRPSEFTGNHKEPGEVLATTTKRDFHKCENTGFTMVELQLSKKIIILCGIHKSAGKKISVTVDGPLRVDI